MRNFLFTISTMLLAFILDACNSCSYLDCATDRYTGQFRIISAADGKDLVFGPNKIYDKNQIKFYSLKGTDTTFFEYNTIKFPNNGYDSILYINFYPAADIAYMKLNNQDTDTLQISYKSRKTKCCGTITEITNFKLNNSINIPGDDGTQEIKK